MRNLGQKETDQERFKASVAQSEEQQIKCRSVCRGFKPRPLLQSSLIFLHRFETGHAHLKGNNNNNKEAKEQKSKRAKEQKSKRAKAGCVHPSSPDDTRKAGLEPASVLVAFSRSAR
jgi:hypothetical protein